MIEQSVGIYEQNGPDSLLQAVSNRLVESLGDAPVDFSFKILNMPEPNAFALPGGYIYISRGLFALLNNESELATILGHEMVHVTRRHSAKQADKATLPALLMLPGALVGSINNKLGSLINAPFALGSQLFMMRYSRGNERESDRLGAQLAFESGYDPYALPEILEHMAGVSNRISGSEEKKSYFSSHPYTPDRVSSLRKYLAKNGLNATSSRNPNGFIPALDGLVWGQDVRNGVIEEEWFYLPGQLIRTKVPGNWKTEISQAGMQATGPEEKALITLIKTGDSIPADSAASLFLSRLASETGMLPVADRNFKKQSFSVSHLQYMLATDDTSYLDLLFIHNGPELMLLAGSCLAPLHKQVLDLLASFEEVKAGELPVMNQTVIRVVHAKEGETLPALSERTGNVWSPELTSLINGIDPAAELEGGRPVKVAVNEIWKRDGSIKE
ncbi:MAG: M48 family metalloprotease [Bacteroidales bacterium]